MPDIVLPDIVLNICAGVLVCANLLAIVLLINGMIRGEL